MPTKSPIFVVLIVSTLALVAAAIFVFRTPQTPPPPPTAADIPGLLEQLPSAAADSNAPPPAWAGEKVLGRYDTMARAGNTLQGRWANNIKDACIAAAPLTSIPDEQAWQEPVEIRQCFDGATVLKIQLKQ